MWSGTACSVKCELTHTLAALPRLAASPEPPRPSAERRRWPLLRPSSALLDVELRNVKVATNNLGYEKKSSVGDVRKNNHIASNTLGSPSSPDRYSVSSLRRSCMPIGTGVLALSFAFSCVQNIGPVFHGGAWVRWMYW